MTLPLPPGGGYSIFVQSVLQDLDEELAKPGPLVTGGIDSVNIQRRMIGLPDMGPGDLIEFLASWVRMIAGDRANRDRKLRLAMGAFVDPAQPVPEVGDADEVVGVPETAKAGPDPARLAPGEAHSGTYWDKMDDTGAPRPPGRKED